MCTLTQMSLKRVILSGIQPTGVPHLGKLINLNLIIPYDRYFNILQEF